MHDQHKYNLITVLGPTASGKTHFASLLAHQLGAEIISADSRQVYRRMDIGTGKDLGDYVVKGKRIPYHLIDIHEPGYKYNVYEYKKDFMDVFQNIHDRSIMPILCGGTGMYIDAVTRNYNLINVPVNKKLRDELSTKGLEELVQILSRYKKLHNRSDSDTKKRAIRAIEIAEYYAQNPIKEAKTIQVDTVFLGIQVDREIRRQRISSRLEKRLEEGMVAEVQSLLDEGILPDDLIYYGLEYKYITQHLIGKIGFDQMQSQLETAIHQFAKRQMTWFRKMEREGCQIHWIDGLEDDQVMLDQALAILA